MASRKRENRTLVVKTIKVFLDDWEEMESWCRPAGISMSKLCRTLISGQLKRFRAKNKLPEGGLDG